MLSKLNGIAESEWVAAIAMATNQLMQAGHIENSPQSAGQVNVSLLTHLKLGLAPV